MICRMGRALPTSFLVFVCAVLLLKFQPTPFLPFNSTVYCNPRFILSAFNKFRF